MKPAYSVILFTTASGAGYGLLFLIGLGVLHGALPTSVGFAVVAMILSLGLVSAGLLSSTFHLGHPERAWRALSQWRSSWLSREGVAAVATYAPALILAIAWIFNVGDRHWVGLFAGLATFGAVATVFCTGQIYATLPTIRQWRTGLTTPVYLLFALASGALFLNAALRVFGEAAQWCDVLVIVSLAVAWAVKGLYWRGIDTALPKHTIESATGLRSMGKVRLLDPPHSEENYLMREMGFKVARKHATRLRRIAVAFGLAAPFLATLALLGMEGFFGAFLAIAAALLGMAGIAVERWLFFAEATHTVQLYYGETTA
ncbi:MAG: DMSO reductase anchor subunit [Alphaproteobacteria bacterium]|jgi:DMSO reductase anchor subunit